MLVHVILKKKMLVHVIFVFYLLFAYIVPSLDANFFDFIESKNLKFRT
jgi:hypothetical protein